MNEETYDVLDVLQKLKEAGIRRPNNVYVTHRESTKTNSKGLDGRLHWLVGETYSVNLYIDMSSNWHTESPYEVSFMGDREDYSYKDINSAIEHLKKNKSLLKEDK